MIGDVLGASVEGSTSFIPSICVYSRFTKLFLPFPPLPFPFSSKGWGPDMISTSPKFPTGQVTDFVPAPHMGNIHFCALVEVEKKPNPFFHLNHKLFSFAGIYHLGPRFGMYFCLSSFLFFLFCLFCFCFLFCFFGVFVFLLSKKVHR